MSSGATIAAWFASRTTAVAIGTVQSAKACARPMARRSPSRSAAGPLFPCCLHRAGASSRYRAAEQGGGLRHPAQDGGRDDPSHQRRPEASRCRDWDDRHAHCLVPGGGIAPDGSWVGCRPGFFLPVRVLSRLYRRLFLERLQAVFDSAKLQYFGHLTVARKRLAANSPCGTLLAAGAGPLRHIWVLILKFQLHQILLVDRGGWLQSLLPPFSKAILKSL